MTQPATPPGETKGPLDAAQKIVAELQGMSPENQSLALQFAMQALRLPSPGAHPAMQHTHAQGHTQSTSAPPNAMGHATDLKSFKEQKQPKSDQQFTALVAYFYRFLAAPADRREAIDGDLMTHAARGVWPQKKRWSMTLTNAKNAGYLDPAERGTFKLSAIGENLIAITLPGDDNAPTGSKGNGGRKKGTKSKSKSKKTTKKGG